MKKILLMAIMAATTLSLSAQLELKDVIGGRFRAHGIRAIIPLDDNRYAQMSDNQHIYAYSYKSGEVTDTLFDASRTRTNSIDDIEGFILAPNGKKALVWRNSKQVFRHSFTADYYVLDIKRRELLPLSKGGAQQAPVFSPDGRYIAFARQGNIFIYKVDFNAEVQVTTDGAVNKVLNGTPDWLYEEEFSCNRLMEFSPDSKSLAFVRLDISKVPTYQMGLYLDAEDTWTPQGGDFTIGEAPVGKGIGPQGVVSFKYPMSGQTNAKPSVCVYDIFYKEIKKMDVPTIDEGDFYIPRIHWTLTADELAIFRLNRSQNQLDMYYANGRSTICKQIYQEKNNTFVDFEDLDAWQWLANGDIVMLHEQDGYRHLYLYSHSGSKKKLLTDGQWDVTNVYGINEETQTIYFQAADQNVRDRSICSVNTSSAKVNRLTNSEGVHNATFSKNCKYFVDNVSSITTPNTYTLRDANGRTVRELKNNDDIKSEWESQNAPVKEWVEFTTERGDVLYGWVVKPANAQGCPALLVQYSGPNSQQALNRWKIDWEYYLAEQGYVVACFDGRGTAARGTQWRKCTYGKLGQLEAEDQISAARWLGKQDYVDADRIGIWGWSYGGFQVLCAMSTGEKVFKAGIAVAPVTDWRFYDSAYSERYMNTPGQNMSGYEKTSPLENADKLNGNLLICSGTADDNVHFQNTMNYVHRLIEADKQFEMQVYPDENHYIRQGNSYQHLYTRMFNFLEKNLK